MPISTNELFEFVIELSKIKELKVAGSNSIKGGLITGTITALGGFLLGPVGFLLGAVLGGGTSSALLKNFQPVWMVLRNLPYESKELLLSKLYLAFRNVGIQDLIGLSGLLACDVSLQNLVIREIRQFMSEELNLRVL